ncbi:MAG TPA: hypothetical protein VF575_05195 [Candidatus Saccharimonadales bacterium]|jgi:hypothetical protein
MAIEGIPEQPKQYGEVLHLPMNYWELVKQAAWERVDERLASALDPIEDDINFVLVETQAKIVVTGHEKSGKYFRELLQEYTERTPEIVDNMRRLGQNDTAVLRIESGTVAPLIAERIVTELRIGYQAIVAMENCDAELAELLHFD